MKIDRETILRQLEAVLPGIATKETVQQSACFAFHGGQVVTYNGQVACFHDCPLEVNGAVPAEPLLDILHNLTADEVDILVVDNRLCITSFKDKTKINIESEIVLPIDNVEQPNEWLALHEEFTEAIQIVQECAREKADEEEITFVHITPGWVEAHDNIQMARYVLHTGVKEAFLVKRDAIKHIVALGMTEFSETDSWVHFRNPHGVRLSCQRHMGDYKDLSFLTNVSGTKTRLPKGLAEAVKRAEIFADEKRGGTGFIKIDLKEGKIRISGRGIHGEHSCEKRLKYAGQRRSFAIQPLLLVEITKRYADCRISESRLGVDGGAFTYVVCLQDATEAVE